MFIVQKFGGTSLGNAERLLQVCEIIRNATQEHSVVCVVSAISSQTKTEGTTSRLLAAGEKAALGDDPSSLIQLIEETHFKLLTPLFRSEALKEKTCQQMVQEFDRLNSILAAVRVLREMSVRSQDAVLGCGERLSAILLAGVLLDQGLPATYVDLSNSVPENCGLNDQQFYPLLRSRFQSQLPDPSVTIPVVTGFFGYVPGGILSSIGRGYSDLTAALIAAEKQADVLEVWKEVDGIYTADPRKVKTAKVLATITPEEAAELTYFGSEVLHPFTVEQAIKASVVIHIKNTLDPQKPGTVIQPNPDSQKTAVAVTTKKDVVILNIRSNRMFEASDFLARVFDVFGKHGIVIDLISTSEVSVSCSTDSKYHLTTTIQDLENLGDVTLLPERAILSLVGQNMKYVPGISAKMFTVLADAGINIEMITQGASEINISCVIQNQDAQRALSIVHQTFLE